LRTIAGSVVVVMVVVVVVGRPIGTNDVVGYKKKKKK
jgi:hypothetical protein